MKKTLLALSVALASLASHAAPAPADLAREKNCLGCHSIDHKVVGPAFKDVAAKYAGQKGAEDKLVQKVLHGTSGTWGSIAMPPNTGVSEKEAHELVKWVLSQK